MGVNKASAMGLKQVITNFTDFILFQLFP